MSVVELAGRAHGHTATRLLPGESANKQLDVVETGPREPALSGGPNDTPPVCATGTASEPVALGLTNLIMGAALS
ncbi:hypothetical protein [Mycobacteroides salmoniphilum]|nr:hypothetical protein [Mycobacteroides salmoniphilum]